MIALVALALGALVGVLARGDMRNLARIRIRGETALVGLLVAQMLIPALRLEGSVARVAFWLWWATLPATAGVALLNRRLPGMACLAAGLTLNAVVVVANGGMPVLPLAALSAGGSEGSWIPPLGDFVHLVAGVGSRLLALADVIPVPAPVRSVVSGGDVVLLAGVAAVIAGIPQKGATAHPHRTGRRANSLPPASEQEGPRDRT